MDFNDLSSHWKARMPAMRRPDSETETLLVIGAATALATALTVALTWRWRKRVARRLEGVTPVDGFEASRFAGRWQEYAHITQHGHAPATQAAMYVSVGDEGELQLARRCYCPLHQQWHTEERTLRPVRTPDIAAFESSDRQHKQYGIVVLDPHYRWAMVVGNTVDQLWLLVRPDTKMPARVLNQMLDEARSLGFDTERLHVLQS